MESLEPQSPPVWRAPARAAVGVSIGLAMVGWASPAIAQHEAFVEALAQFTAALPGTYGDEADAIREGAARLERGLAEWDNTLREYERNVLVNSATASASRVLDMHRAMGMADLARGRFDAAVRELDAAASLSPEPELRLFGGLAHQAAGRSSDALKAYAAAWALNKADPVAAYMLAEAGFRSASSVPPDVLAVLSDVVDRIAAGQYAGARDPFPAVGLLPDDVSETPIFVPWWYSESYANLERSQYAKAVETLRASAEKDPLVAASASPALRRGSEALRAGQVARAVEEFAAAVRETPTSEPHRMLGVAYWLSADDERSVEHLEQAVRLSPTDERSRVTLARILEDIGETGRAERVLAETVDAIPSSAMAHSRLGRMHAAANRIQDAVREYEAAVGIGALSGNEPLLLEISDLYRRELDSVRSEAAFARAVALRPNDEVAHRERGRAWLQLERPDAALVELAAALLVDPEDYDCYVLIGQIHLEAGRYPQAIRLMTRAIAIDREKPGAYYGLATALARSGRGDEGAPYRETFARLQARALEAQRHSIEMSTTRLQAGVLAEKGEFDRALPLWTRLVADEPNVAANHAGLAATLAGLGRLEMAAERYEKVLDLNPGAVVYRNAAAFFERIGRRDAAGRTRAKLARTRQAAYGLAAPVR